MTRKDYRNAANAIVSFKATKREKVMLVVFSLRVFSEYNNFDYDRFMTACGVTLADMEKYEDTFNAET